MTLKLVASLALVLPLSACASLPSSGPTGKEILRGALPTAPDPAIDLVEINAPQIAGMARVDQSAGLADLPPPPTDMVGPGDVLQIYIYEAGVSLFAGATGPASASAVTGVSDSGVKSQALPPARVNDDGNIYIPYAGKLHVMGRTVTEIQSMIRHALQGLSQHPQVLVTLNTSITNSIILSGEVNHPGRLVLQTNNETLSDVIALAGGYRGNAKDLGLRIIRRGRVINMRLSDLTNDSPLDVRAYPGDRLMLIQDPRSFSVLGASGRVSQVLFPRPEISLAEAIASVGGTDPNYGDPAAIFVFRYVPNENGEKKPVIYHLNMMQTKAYFFAQNFKIRNDDVLYFGNAAANRPSKMLQLVSQLFSPIMTVVAAARAVQN